ncbi:LuxR C-terminal-related transcriptional regulator [Kitasatospora sp. HPMI-4]|uniref:LuxR C-terminal-related transcriptional regulator n=1 Tax=Kitasatospora sp. HPMI-4 TaxID=3448443 RepID=UPI003F1A4E2C
MKPTQTCLETDNCPQSDGICIEALECYERALAGEGIRTSDVPPCLAALGMMVERDDVPGLSQALPPTVGALASLQPLDDQLAEIKRRRATVRAALSVYESVYAQFQAGNRIDISLLSGKPVIDRALDAAALACRSELLTAQPGGGRPVEVLEEAVAREQAFADRGVRRRTLYQHTVRFHQPTLAYAQRVTTAGAEVRTVPEVFERLIVIDREVAFIPVGEIRSSAALEIRHPGLIRYLVLMFDHMWERATPLDPAAREEQQRHVASVLSDIQSAILTHVVAGETDDVIARRLGMSRRSVVEHVRKVSKQLGTNSRAQLGYVLAKSGLLNR